MPYIIIFLVFTTVYAVLLMFLRNQRLASYMRATKLDDPYVLTDDEKKAHIDFMTNFDSTNLKASKSYKRDKLVLFLMMLLMFAASLYDFMTIHHSFDANTTTATYFIQYAFPVLYFAGSLSFYTRYENAKTAYLRALYKEEADIFRLEGDIAP